MESNVTKMPGIEILPEELLVEILKYLSHADRLTCAETSKRFAVALSHPQLLKDIWLSVGGDEMGKAVPVLIKSSRRYQNLRLIRVRLMKFDSEFWGRISGTLRRLTLDHCCWTFEVLHDILRECSSLEYLSMTSEYVQKPPLGNIETCGTSVGDVRASLSNVKHLRLKTHSVDVLGHLLGLIPNVSSVCLRVSMKRFDWLALINRTLVDPRIVTEIDLGWDPPSDEDLILLMGAFSGTLRDLRLVCTLLTSRAGGVIAECSRLRRLLLDTFDELENAHMTTILRNNPGLEMLDLIDCDSLTDDGLSPIHELMKLRRLNIRGCFAISNEFLCRLGEILTLEYLDLSRTRVDSTTIQSIACLKNLEGLHVDLRFQSSESLRTICMSFGRLRTLSLGNCRNLSDADGLMLSRLKRLRTLEVRKALGFKDLAIEGGIGGSGMESLTVVGSSLTDLGLLSLVGQRGRLEDIILHECDNITNQGLVTVLQRAPLLRKLQLESCSSIGDEFIKTLADCCPRLWSVEIRNCATSSRAVEFFRERRPTVNVTHTNTELLQ